MKSRRASRPLSAKPRWLRAASDAASSQRRRVGRNTIAGSRLYDPSAASKFAGGISGMRSFIGNLNLTSFLITVRGVPNCKIAATETNYCQRRRMTTIRTEMNNASPTKAHKNQGIAISIFLGIALFFTLPFMLAPVYAGPIWIFLPVLMSCYFAVALILGFFWRELSWRIGLWLFLVWPPALAFAAFLAGEQPWHWKRELISISQYPAIMVAACVGGWLGRFISRRRVAGQ